MSKISQITKHGRTAPDEISGQSDVFRDTDLRPNSEGKKSLSFEVFVQPNFSQLEFSSVISVLEAANEVQNKIQFTSNIISDVPGLVANGNILVRAEPAIGVQYLKHCLIIVGGTNCISKTWMGRVRAMQRLGRPVVLFSDAATEYIRVSAPTQIPVTTHWRHIEVLNEVGNFPTLSTRLVEYGNGIFTCAGMGHAMEVVFSLAADLLSPQERAEMASLLVIDGIRGFHREQPKGVGHSDTFLEGRLQSAIQLMEATIEDPLPIWQLAEKLDISTRQLERLFKIQLSSSPAKTYKVIRVKRARSLVVETRMPMIEIALACGFSSTSSLSSAYRHTFGVTPKQARSSGSAAKLIT